MSDINLWSCFCKRAYKGLVFWGEFGKIKIMNRYSKKRLKIGLVYLIIFVIIVGGIYLLSSKNKPTCYDGIQNQGEAGIDCGGPCPLCDWQKQKDIEIIWQKIIPTRENFIDLAAKIKNPNQEFGAKILSYEFILYNNQNQVIKSIKGTSYASPQESKYIIEPKIETNEKVNSIKLQINSIEWQELLNYQEPDLLVQNTQFNQVADQAVARGVVENRSNYDFNRIDVFVILFNENNKVIGAGKMNLKTILSGERREFKMMWPFELEEKVAKIDAIAETNIFLDENFMKRYGGEKERFQEY